MRRRNFLALAAGLPWIVSSCSQQPVAKKVGVNAWIGYAPLVYAGARGWLQDIPVQLYTTVSLGESLALFESDQVDAFSATQYEYHLARQDHPDLVPVMLLDRSNGGDGIVGNMPLARLREETRPIDVYLEADSINRELFEQFVKLEGLQDKTFRLHDQDQQSNTLLDPHQPSPIIVVTYSPYLERLLKSGFVMLANTRDMPLLVIDALFALRDDLKRHHQAYVKLKRAVDRAIEDFKSVPEQVYPFVRGFLGIHSQQALREAMAGIVWINHPDEALLQRISQLDIPVSTVIP